MKTNKVMKINNMRTLRNKKIPILIVRAQQLKHIGFDFDFVLNKGIGFYFGFERRQLCILVLIS